MLTFFLLFRLAFLVSVSSDLILKPIKQGSNTAAIIFIPGAGLPPDRYVPLLEQVQKTSPNTLWIAIPSFLDNYPSEKLRPKVIDEMLSKLQSAGMPEQTSILLGGHSLGGFTSQILALKYTKQLSGQILLGAFLQRIYQSTNASYPISTLTISGELDGITRVTRIIESVPFSSNYPIFTLIIPGMNHMDIASGQPTDYILKNDIPSEINQTIAHEQLAVRIADYINMLLNHQTITPLLESNLNQTRQFSQPYLQALNLEGSYHLLPPCYNQTTNDRCQLGSPWSAYGQKILGGLNDTVQMNISDEFHIVYQPPEHFAHLDNNCSSIKPLNNCVLYVHTVTQNLYDSKDDQDTGDTHSSAEEMRVKMISRQVLYQAADGQSHDFNQTDNQSLCGLVNQYALNWALENAGSTTKARYDQIGKKMLIGDDVGPLNAGPLWIWTPLVSMNEE